MIVFMIDVYYIICLKEKHYFGSFVVSIVKIEAYRELNKQEEASLSDGSDDSNPSLN